MKKPIIITFSGLAQHGKSESANILKTQLNKQGKRVLIANYTDQLKHIARQYMGWNGEKDEQGRSLLQNLGLEKSRYRYPNYWVDTVIGIAKLFEDDYDYILISDCRFPNDISRWKEEGYVIIPVHVERLDFKNNLTEEQKKHPSETALDGYPFEVYLKAKTLEEMEIEIGKKIVWVEKLSIRHADNADYYDLRRFNFNKICVNPCYPRRAIRVICVP
jgi:hypothetical protein